MDGRSCAEIRRRARGAAAGLALLAVCSAAPRETRAGAADDSGQRQTRRQEEEARLQRVHYEIEDLRRRLEQGETSAGSVLDAMEELDLRMALLRRESESLRGEVRAAAEGERSARREAEALEARLAQTESGLRDYLRETYKIGPARYLRVVTAASSPAQVASGYRAIEAVSLGEAGRIDTYRADRDRLGAVLAELRSRGERLRELQASLEGKARELRGVRERRAPSSRACKGSRRPSEPSLASWSRSRGRSAPSWIVSRARVRQRRSRRSASPATAGISTGRPGDGSRSRSET